MRKLRLKKNKHNGKLIVIEGAEKSGKSTYVKVLGDYLLKHYDKDNFVYVKTPSLEVVNSRLFKLYKYEETDVVLHPNALLFLLMSEMLQITKELIIPYLKKGKTVICEGYIYFAYCYLLHKKVKCKNWFYSIKSEFIKPDIVFYVNVDFKTSIGRIMVADNNRVINHKKYKKFISRFYRLAKKSDFVQLEGKDNKLIDIKHIETQLQGHKVI